jgi:hypothetical protein
VTKEREDDAHHVGYFDAVDVALLYADVARGDDLGHLGRGDVLALPAERVADPVHEVDVALLRVVWPSRT